MALGEVLHVTSCHLLHKDIAEIFLEPSKFNIYKVKFLISFKARNLVSARAMRSLFDLLC